MNKELIIKYKTEFDHWLNGGKLLIKMSTGWEPVPTDYAWHLTDKLYVINDSYCIYRKALAEGKTLQYNFGNYGINRKDFPNIWKDLDQSIGILADRTCPENYRIKPEEPKFKVGDWVRDKKRKYKPFMVTSSDLEADSPNYVKIDCELWKPQLGEWCWFYDGRSYDTPCLRKFITIIDDTYIALNSQNSKHITPTKVPSFEKGISDSYQTYKNCEPFIGQLPSYLKE